MSIYFINRTLNNNSFLLECLVATFSELSVEAEATTLRLAPCKGQLDLPYEIDEASRAQKLQVRA